MSRTKQQWLDETGGFRTGETAAQFQERVGRIQHLRAAFAEGTATVADLDELAQLLDAGDGGQE